MAKGTLKLTARIRKSGAERAQAMESDLKIVRMRREDIPAIHEIEELSFSTPWSVNVLEQEFEFPLSVLFVAVVGEERVVGFAGIHHIIDEGFINNIAVHPDFRKLGIGRKLLGALKDYGEQNDFYRLTLEVRVSNLAAQRLYEGLGFINEGIRPGYYDKPKEDAFIFSHFYRED